MTSITKPETFRALAGQSISNRTLRGRGRELAVRQVIGWRPVLFVYCQF